MGWKVQYFPSVHTVHGAHPAFHNINQVSFPDVKQPDHGANHSPHLTSQLKKE